MMASHGLLPVIGSKNALFLAGLADGVTGLQISNIVCFTCEHQESCCAHVSKLETSEGELVFEMPDFLMDFFAEKHFMASSAAFITQTSHRRSSMQSLFL